MPSGSAPSRIRGHRAMSGYCVPGTFAAEDELRAIADGMVAGGGAVFQVIPSGAIGDNPEFAPEQAPLADEIQMFGRLSRDTGLRVVFSTFQTNDNPEGWRDTLRIVGDENARGAAAPPDGRAPGRHRADHPRWLPPVHAAPDVPSTGPPARSRRWWPSSDAPRSRRPSSPRPMRFDDRPGSMQNILPPIFARTLALTFEMGEPLDYEPTLDQSLAARAAAEGRNEHEFLYDFLLQDDGRAVGVFLGANYVDGNLDACRSMLLDPHTVSGLSDAGAHVNFICDMSNPTFHLTHWVRDRTRGEKLPIEAVVRQGDIEGGHQRSGSTIVASSPSASGLT